MASAPDGNATAIFWRPQVALFVDEHTLLPALLPLAPASTLLRRFPHTVAETLAAHEAPVDFAVRTLDEIGDDAVCVPTASRSTLGVVNELVRHAGYALADSEGDLDLVGLAVWLAHTPMSPLYKRHISPDRELAALIEISDPARGWSSCRHRFVPMPNHESARRDALDPLRKDRVYVRDETGDEIGHVDLKEHTIAVKAAGYEASLEDCLRRWTSEPGLEGPEPFPPR